MAGRHGGQPCARTPRSGHRGGGARHRGARTRRDARLDGGVAAGRRARRGGGDGARLRHSKRRIGSRSPSAPGRSGRPSEMVRRRRSFSASPPSATTNPPTTSVSRTRWSGDCARTERGLAARRDEPPGAGSGGRRRGRVRGGARRGRGPAGPARAAGAAAHVRAVGLGARVGARCRRAPFDGAVVVPSEGATVLGEAEGSGLAAETTATPPATSNSPEIAAVRIARRTPLGLVSTGATATGATGWMGAGTSGWKGGSMRTPCSRLGRLLWTNLTRSVANAPERHMRTRTGGSGRPTTVAGSRPRRSRRGSGSGPGRSGACRSIQPPRRAAPTTRS